MWDDVDRRYVESGSQDTVIFVGDFGEEDVAIVSRIASLECEKAVILGNHDGWWAMRRGGGPERVDAQLAALGDAHIGYRAVMANGGGYALLGARPFSWGGGWKTMRPFYERLYGVRTNDDSADLILQAADSVPGVPLVLVGHNGPKGLGEGRDAIYGCDFRKPHIDFGDPDQLLALSRLRTEMNRQSDRHCCRSHARSPSGWRQSSPVGAGERDGPSERRRRAAPRRGRGLGLRRHYLEVVLEGGALAEAPTISGSMIAVRWSSGSPVICFAPTLKAADNQRPLRCWQRYGESNPGFMAENHAS